MCGITGIAGKKANHSLLSRMVDRIAHRGPDGKGTWSDGVFSLGHLRLSIIDLSERASQPMVCHMTGNRLSFNGEIYNYREIKAELAGSYPFKSDSDSEVILAAYQTWGIEAIRKLRGMFAFAIYDQTKRQLLLVRDRFGIKPLYYRKNENAFIFSSEIKGLIGLDEQSHSPNLLKVYGFIAYRHLDTDSDTFFNEVKQLPAASYTWIDENGVMSSPAVYWTPPMPGQSKFSEPDKKCLIDVLRDSVQMHLRSDVPVASFVSGGIDSSTVASLAYQLLGEKYSLQTYSSILREMNSENRLISDVQAHPPRSTHYGIMLKGENFLTEISKITYHHDEPLADASMYAHWELCKLASKNGVKVMLSGNGGDEVFCGYPAYLYSLLGRFIKQFQFTKFLRYIEMFSQNRGETITSLLAHSLYETIPIRLKEIIKARSSMNINKFLNFDLNSNYIYYPYDNKDPYDANYLNYLKAWTIPPFLHYEDRNSMAFGIEIRVPMLDHILLQFVSSFRPEDLLSGQTKNLIRTSMRQIVPDSILDQKNKFGFAAPLNEYLLINPEKTYRFFLEQTEGISFISYESMKHLARKAILERDETSLMYMWRILSVSVWYKTFFHE